MSKLFGKKDKDKKDEEGNANSNLSSDSYLKRLRLDDTRTNLDEVKELYGFETAAIVDMNEVVECLYNKEVNGEVIIDDTLKAAIDAYYEQYGAK